MRSPSVLKLPKVIAVLAALAALVYVLAQPSAPPEVTTGSATTAALMSPSEFAASGGLVPDTDTSVPSASDALRHAAVAAPVTEDASTF